MRLPAILASCALLALACKEPPPPPPVPAVDPRVDAPAGQMASPPFGGSAPDAELDLVWPFRFRPRAREASR